MKRSVSKKLGAATRPKNGRARLLAVASTIFTAGIGLGMVFGGWIAGQDVPTTQVALTASPPQLEVTVRAYRPPVRESRPALLVPLKTPGPSKTPAAKSAKPAVAAAPAAKPTQPIRLDGATRKTWLANAVPSPAAAGRPMIAIVIDDLGIDQARTRKIIALPAPLTLAFIPYGYNLKQLSRAGRRAGHELIVHVNMEPKDRGIDAGPHALLTELSGDEIRARLNWALTRFDGFVGISNHMGSRFTEWPDGVEVLLQVLRGRGLLFLDSLTSQKSVGAPLARAHGMAYAVRDVFLDNDRTGPKVARQLAETERIARQRGYAIALGHPHDVTFAALKDWIPAVKKRGFVLVPLSAIVRQRMGEG